jgi:hypothetical protein
MVKRITVALEPDVAALLRKVVRERGEPFKQVVNAAIRAGLTGARRRTARTFKQPTFDRGKPRVDLTKALALGADLDDGETMTPAKRRRR